MYKRPAEGEPGGSEPPAKKIVFQPLQLGAITNLVLGWLLGPGWGTSMGLIAVLAGLVLALGNRSDAS